MRGDAPGQQLLDLKQPQRIVAARHEEMGDVNVRRRVADQHARHQRHHVARLKIEVGALDDGKARQQRLTFDFRQAVHARLLNEIVCEAVLADVIAQRPRRLQRHADLVERQHVGPETADFLGDQAAAGVPTLVALLQVEGYDPNRHPLACQRHQ